MNMKLIKKITLVSVVFAFSASAFSAAFLKFDGVEGESKDKDHKGWIDVLSVSGLTTQSAMREKGSGMATGKREKGSGLATGKRQHKPITITKPVDKSSPMLARSSGNPQFPSKMVLSQDGIAYELSGVSVKSVRRLGKNEELVLTYTGVKQSSATDYNSSRSNKNSRSSVAAPPANHNTTRSNKTIRWGS